MKKTAKQEFLDKEKPTQHEEIVQELLLRNTKTGLAKIGRAIKELNRTLYKSWMKEQQFENIYLCLEQAYKLASEKEATDADIQNT